MRCSTTTMRRAAAGLVLGLTTAIAACTTRTEPSGPLEVKVTEISPEVAEDIAARVVERMEPTGTARTAREPHVRRLPPPTVVEHPPAPVKRPLPKRLVPSVAEHEPADEAIELALGWLARRQKADGRWECDYFDEKDNRGTASRPAHLDPGVTGLALLCFLSNGHTHQSGAHKDVVEKGLKYLRQIQDTKGVFGPRTSHHYMYNHASASLAMVTAYELTGSPILKGPSESAVDFIHRAQNPYLGWRYMPRSGDNDTSMTGWMTAVLATAGNAGLDVDANAFKGAVSWVEKMTEPEFGRVGYIQRGGRPARTMAAMDHFPSDRSEAPTAIGLTIRLQAGQDPETNDLILKGANLLAARPPEWDPAGGSIDMYYWFWGTRALREIGGVHWSRWSKSLETAVGGHQIVDPDHAETGSWEPVDAWSAEGGRVYATAMCCLSLTILDKARASGPK